MHFADIIQMTSPATAASHAIRTAIKGARQDARLLDAYRAGDRIPARTLLRDAKAAPARLHRGSKA